MPFVPSFKTNTSSTSSFMLSFFLCNSGTLDDDDDTYSSSYIPYSMRVEAQSQISRSPSSTLKKSKTKSKKKSSSKMVIGSPTDFRHDAHLGTDFKTDLSYAVWDSERWRQELMKKNLFLPPLVEPTTTDDTKEPLLPSSNPKANKRNSITPQKRKPVPPLSEPFLPTPEPHEVPLPPSPTDSSQTFEDARSQTVSSSDAGTFSDFSLPSLVGHSSRGPSMDVDLVPSPKCSMLEEQEQEQVKPLETHVIT